MTFQILLPTLRIHWYSSSPCWSPGRSSKGYSGYSTQEIEEGRQKARLPQPLGPPTPNDFQQFQPQPLRSRVGPPQRWERLTHPHPQPLETTAGPIPLCFDRHAWPKLALSCLARPVCGRRGVVSMPRALQAGWPHGYTLRPHGCGRPADGFIPNSESRFAFSIGLTTAYRIRGLNHGSYATSPKFTDPDPGGKCIGT